MSWKHIRYDSDEMSRRGKKGRKASPWGQYNPGFLKKAKPKKPASK